MADDQFRLNIGLSLVMLSPLHYTMGALFESSKKSFHEDSQRVGDIVSSVNMCSSRLIRILRADTEDRGGFWGIARWMVTGTPVLDASCRSYMRREMMRIIGGFHMRLVRPLQSQDVQLWDMMEQGGSDEMILRKASYVEERPCCAGQAAHRFHRWLRSASVSRLRRVKKAWVP